MHHFSWQISRPGRSCRNTVAVGAGTATAGSQKHPFLGKVRRFLGLPGEYLLCLCVCLQSKKQRTAFSPVKGSFVLSAPRLKTPQSRFHLQQDRRIMGSNTPSVMGHRLSVLICWPQKCTIIIAAFIREQGCRCLTVFRLQNNSERHVEV